MPAGAAAWAAWALNASAIITPGQYMRVPGTGIFFVFNIFTPEL
jgi:hypothetical protein